MRAKELKLIVTFHTTTAAMAMEKACAAAGIPGRLIPVPREITAGCGLSWKALPEEQELLISALTQAGMKWAEYHILEV